METATPLLLQTIAVALVAGVGSQILAERLSLPSIVPLLLSGALLGPEVLDWIDPGSLGGGLEVLVGLSVAIILFEGGMNLEWAHLRSESGVLLRLVLVGSLITMAAGALAAMALLPLGAPVAWLLASVVVVTGPTVIGPLLKRVRIVRRVSFLLESEGVLIDPVGAILAFVMLELVLSGESSLTRGPGSILTRFAVGGAVGAAAALLIATILRQRWTRDPQLANLMTLAIVVGSYVLSNRVLSESGLMAAVVSGVVVGNLGVPGKRELLAFKGILTTLVLSLVFVLLAGDIHWSILLDVGPGGLAWVAVLILVVRPLSVFLSTAGARVPLSDRLLISWISPRGIVAASVASLFAIFLERHGIEEGELLKAMVFLTIATTVLVQGLTAGVVARHLGLAAGELGVVIVGANRLGRLLGRLLRDRGREVALIDANPWNCRLAQKEGLAAYTGNCLEVENLERIGLRVADCLVALTPNSGVNYLVSRLALEEFRTPRALARISAHDESVDPETRASQRLQHAFATEVPDDLEYTLRKDPPLFQAEVTAEAPTRLKDLDPGEGIPLVRIRNERAEPCGDETPLAAGDRILFLREPGGAGLTNVEPLPLPDSRS